jgi:hypothetical protein
MDQTCSRSLPVEQNPGGGLAKHANAGDTTTTQQVLIAVAEEMEEFTGS